MSCDETTGRGGWTPRLDSVWTDLFFYPTTRGTTSVHPIIGDRPTCGEPRQEVESRLLERGDRTPVSILEQVLSIPLRFVRFWCVSRRLLGTRERVRKKRRDGYTFSSVSRTFVWEDVRRNIGRKKKERERESSLPFKIVSGIYDIKSLSSIVTQIVIHD